MSWCRQFFIVCSILTINIAIGIHIKPSLIQKEQKPVNAKRYILNTAKGNATSVNNKKKTLIDITGSEFPETNYHQQEFFFDTTHDFGDYDNEEILNQSELKLDNEYETSVLGNGRSDLLGQKEMSSFDAITQESFDNDDLEAINQENERVMEKYGRDDDDTYKYDEEGDSFYPTTPG